MPTVGDYSIPQVVHAGSLLFAALAQLIETGLEVLSLLSLALQLPFKLINQGMGGVARLRVASTTRASLASGRTVRSSHTRSLLLGPDCAVESSHALGLVASATRDRFSHLLSSQFIFDAGEFRA